VFLVSTPVTQKLKEVAADYGIDVPMISLSEVKVVRTPSSHKKRDKNKERVPSFVGCFDITVPFDYSGHNSVSFSTTKDISKAVYYVELDENKRVKGSENNHISCLEDHIRTILLAIGMFDDGRIIGLKSSKVHLYPHLRSFKDLLDDYESTFLDSVNVALVFLENIAFRNYMYDAFDADELTIKSMLHYYQSVKNTVNSIEGTVNPFLKLLENDTLTVVEERGELLREAVNAAYNVTENTIEKAVYKLLDAWQALVKDHPYLAYDYKTQAQFSVNHYDLLIYE
jgi:hypothetical protein